jgi:hypothetical protein
LVFKCLKRIFFFVLETEADFGFDAGDTEGGGVIYM